MPTLSDFPKIYCPFIRQTFKVNTEQWKQHGSSINLRSPEVYLVINRINPGYEWVYEDKETIAVEKLNGTNIKLLTENGKLIALQNRLNVIDPLQIIKGKTFIIEGIFRSIGKGYVAENGEQAGELIGPKVNGNPYKLDFHEWYPFQKAIGDLKYRSFHEHERNFENWSSWFKDNLHSRYFTKRASKLGLDEKVFAEGVVFYNLKRKAEGKSWMSKLRRDMYPWFYSDKMEIYDYTPEGKTAAEDQEQFD
ncbi:MAG: hypothetical protein HY072_07825 [Deltaproteobacteria bacterium]|nr:hypothetical protein [Deltaproteobacteria bacterium]